MSRDSLTHIKRETLKTPLYKLSPVLYFLSDHSGLTHTVREKFTLSQSFQLE